MENRDEDLHFQKMNKFFIESSKKKEMLQILTRFY